MSESPAQERAAHPHPGKKQGSVPDAAQQDRAGMLMLVRRNAGRSFFASLDSDKDGAVSVEDLRAAMRARKLPEAYAHQFLARARRGRWWAQRVRWPEFKRMADEKEPAMLRAFTALEGVNAAGQMELKQIKACGMQPSQIPSSCQHLIAVTRSSPTPFVKSVAACNALQKLTLK